MNIKKILSGPIVWIVLGLVILWIAFTTLSRPMSTERICETYTVSWRWIGYGRRQLKPAPTVLL